MFSYKDRTQLGFTLIETISVLFILGIVASVAVPSFFAFLSRYHVNGALEQLLGAIRETQQQAIRKGRRCRIDINTSTNNLTGNPSGCLLSSRNINGNIIIRTNLPGANPNIVFSSKGTTTRMGTIVLSSNGSQKQKCFVISLGLGIMRTGNYIGSRTGSVSAKNCEKNSS